MSPPLDYGAYPGQPSQRSLPPPTQTQATWALVLAFIPAVLTWIAAIVLAIMVLVQSKDGRNFGKGKAIAALVVVGLWVVLLGTILIAVIANQAERDPSGAVSLGGDVSVTALKPGDCVVDDISEEVYYTVTIASCDVKHRHEVYATYELQDGKFPGQDEVDRLSEGGCIKRYEDYVGAPYDESDLEMYFLRPFPDSWSVDRGVACLISTGSTDIGSLKNSELPTS